MNLRSSLEKSKKRFKKTSGRKTSNFIKDSYFYTSSVELIAAIKIMKAKVQLFVIKSD